MRACTFARTLKEVLEKTANGLATFLNNRKYKGRNYRNSSSNLRAFLGNHVHLGSKTNTTRDLLAIPPLVLLRR